MSPAAKAAPIRRGPPRSITELFRERMPQAGYAVREPQVQLANHIQAAVRNRRSILAEAGVGTGKTLAYLGSALINNPGQGIVVSTNTIVLQEQILRKDVPALRSLGWPGLRAFVAKGKGNYLCLAKYHAQQQQGWSWDFPAAELARLDDWVRQGGYDRATLSGVSGAAWKQVALDYRTNCRACPIAGSCGYAKDRLGWKDRDAIAITNHAQLLTALEAWARGSEGPFPRPGVIVVDEAHTLLGAVQEHLTHRLGVREALDLMDGLSDALRGHRGQVVEDIHLLERMLTLILEDLGKLSLKRGNGEDETSRMLVERLPQGLLEEIAYTGDLVRAIADELKLEGTRSPAVTQLEDLYEIMRAVIEPGTLQWVEVDGPNRTLAAMREDPADWLRKHLFGLGLPVVLVSATLSVRGDFGYVRRQLGDPVVTIYSAPSPFDYDRQVRVYAPEPGVIPDYRWETSELYYQRTFEETARIIRESGGNTLVLLTSRKALAEARRFFAHHPLANRFPMLFQGDTGAADVIEKFRSLPGSCLFGTAFWEGLDVVGEALGTVVIPKLPYPQPDPVLDHEIAQASQAGLDGFRDVITPRMLLRLRQGVGWLIRSEADRGRVAILDPRFQRQRLRWSDILPFRAEPAPAPLEGPPAAV